MNQLPTLPMRNRAPATCNNVRHHATASKGALLAERQVWRRPQYLTWADRTTSLPVNTRLVKAANAQAGQCK